MADMTVNPTTVTIPTAQAEATADAGTQAAGNADTGLEMAQATSDEFTAQASELDADIDKVDEALNEVDNEALKQELQSKKASLLAKKEELSARQGQLKNRIAALKSASEAYSSKVQSQKMEIADLNAQKENLQKQVDAETKELEAKQVSIKDIDNNIKDTKADLDSTLSDLHNSVEQMNQESDNQLKQQRDMISAATTEAMAMCESGQIKKEDMPSYIANKINGCTSTGNVAGIGLIDAKNTKVKALCGQVSSYLSQKGRIEVEIKAVNAKIDMSSPLLESLNANIKSKTSDMKNTQDLMNGTNSELVGLNLEYLNNNSQIDGIDSQVKDIDPQLETIDAVIAEDAEGGHVNNGVNDGHGSHRSHSGQSSNNGVGGNSSNNDYGIDDIDYSTDSVFNNSIKEKLNNIDKTYNEILKQDVVNPEITNLTSKMEDTDKMVLTLRNKLLDNAQKLIEERLEATKRR